MHAHALSDIYNELDIGVVVVVRATWDLNILVGHPDVVCVCSQILRRGHDGELDCALISERLVRPLAYGTDLFDCSNTIVRN